MSKDISESVFNSSINSWTLAFKDSEEEAKFLQKMDSSLHFPLASRIIAYTAVSLNFLFRVYDLIVISFGLNAKAGTLKEELWLIGVVAAVFIIEGILKFAQKLNNYRGFLMYVVFPTSAIYAAFFVNHAPVIGLPYRFLNVTIIK